MTETERAIETLALMSEEYHESVARGKPKHYDTLWQAKADACDISIQTLREKAEREKGCAWCKGDWTDNFTVIDDDFGVRLTNRHVKFCPMCGKKLESEAGK